MVCNSVDHVINFCLQGFKTNKGEPGSTGLDSGGKLSNTDVTIRRTPKTEGHVKYQIVSLKSQENRVPTRILNYVFGGGFVAGSPDQYLPLTSQLVQVKTKEDNTEVCWVVAPYYALNTPFPVPPNQVLAVATTLAKKYKNATMYIGGDSAGGTIACGVALMQPKLFHGMFMYSPWLNLASNSYTYKSRAFCKSKDTGDPIFTTPDAQNKRDSLKEAKIYFGSQKNLNNPFINPIRASRNMLKSLPPTIIFVGDRETVLGDSELFMSRLQAVRKSYNRNPKLMDSLQVYAGMWHVFPVYSQGCGSGTPLQPALAAIDQTRAFIRGKRLDKLTPLKLPNVDAKLVLLPQSSSCIKKKIKTYRQPKLRFNTRRIKRGSSTRRRKA